MPVETLDPGTVEDLGTSPSVVAVEPGDHERFAHYVPKAHVLRAAVEGKPAIALCGKVWVPVRDPARFPVCPECKKIHDAITG